VDIELLHRRADPAYQALALPLAWLSKEVASRNSSSIMVGGCVEQAVQDMGGPETPSKTVPSLQARAKGPVGAAVARALTLGWRHQGRHAWMIPDGDLVDFEALDPFDVKQLVEDQVARWLWCKAAKRHEHLAHLDCPPHLVEARKLTSASGALTAPQKGLLRAFLAGAFFRADVSRCGAVFPNSMQLWAHLAWQCEATAELRSWAGETGDTPAPESFRQRILPFVHTHWVQTAMLPDPWQDTPVGAGTEIVRWRC
jgi:hypothetical protein